MNTQRSFDDTTLSAFIDGELPAHEMQAVNAELARDPALAQRYAALKLANDLVLQHARALDDVPLRAATLALLQPDATAAAPANVIQGPWRRWTHVQRALAASLVIGIGLAVAYWQQPGSPDALPALAAYSAQLDTAPSGSELSVAAATLTTRFSFRDSENRYCRQYQLSTETAASQNIACRSADGWTLVTSLPDAPPAAGAAYQPASSSASLNAALDSMMQGAALDLETEAALIRNGWQDE